ncbi:VPDSG-CTERM sorting domain-containing protein [Pelagicoccus sp. NFK12]|uniref:VPDSG-CTERM sorting domain-containing protein n=1 Tax=Pelagicoccus enzymogenes TaxID=2773457 RepID=A0A927IHB0_9BACT|nr:VPDSG-CTERM sorting domain-containing protein [Pelagicoccus enzymogenes]MBD5779533.1 VPDSG-CTERM sorting domain-containing protein [Pelagicoccus enzymogenes]MDQ8200324.1 VPDSG-CTERM sorting domain-containing protein [Pelagicoccus enzymogenes]
MKKNLFSKKLATLLSAAICVAASTTHAVSISESDIVSNWDSGASTGYRIQYGGTNNNSSWIQSGNTVASNGNRTGSLVSDFVASGDWSFSTKIRNNGDNDFSGIVFGFQDIANSYVLGWGGGGVSGLNGIQLFKGVAGVKTLLASQAGNWASNVTYDFIASRSGNNLTATIKNGATTIFSQTVVDTSFMTGKVGFDTYSQNTSFSFGSTDFTSNTQGVPDSGSTLALLGFAFAGVVAFKRRRGA